MEALFEIIIEIVFEIFLQVFAEPVGRWISPYVDSKSKKYSRAGALAVKVPVYSLFGFLVGGLSLWIRPHHFVASVEGRVAALVIGPLVAGAAMSLVGRQLERRGHRRTDFERFAYGACFAFAYALTRWIWAR